MMGPLGYVLFAFALASTPSLPDRVPEVQRLRMRVMNYEIDDAKRLLDALIAKRNADGADLMREYQFNTERGDTVDQETGIITRKGKP